MLFITIFYVPEDQRLSKITNFDLNNIFTPVRADRLEQLLIETNYDHSKTRMIVDGFKEGFDLGYRGPWDVQITSNNLKFVIGNEAELWDKMVNEVKSRRFAGPYRNIPFEHYIQSPIGLVPKDGGTKTRLIFHLSYPKDGETSVNFHTPKELSTVTYKDFEAAVKLCILNGKGCAAGKSDFSAAFRHLPLAKKFWKLLVMKAKCPEDKNWYYFIDKCLPFGSSRSCALFQAFSDCIAHIMQVKTGHENVNYLDDFFFVAMLKLMCDAQIQRFLNLCQFINFPVSLAKTEWGTTRIVFLGLLIDTMMQKIFVPHEKVQAAKLLIEHILNKRSLTKRQLQQVCGFLNFLGKAIVPGRAFTRRLYAHENKVDRVHLHIHITQEMRLDLECWYAFLCHPSVYSQDFADFQETNAIFTNFATDASKNSPLGVGGICGTDWFVQQWDEDFIINFDPSIAYLELFGVTVAASLWLNNFRNKSIIIHCDNQSVVHMINKNMSSCKNCMVLLRFLILHCLCCNVKIVAWYVRSKDNLFPDLLSRLRYREFCDQSKLYNVKFNNRPCQLPDYLWPMDKIWLN